MKVDPCILGIAEAVPSRTARLGRIRGIECEVLDANFTNQKAKEPYRPL